MHIRADGCLFQSHFLPDANTSSKLTLLRIPLQGLIIAWFNTQYCTAIHDCPAKNKLELGWIHLLVQC